MSIKTQEDKIPKKKKYVQTSLFEPIINNKEKMADIRDIISKIDLKSDIPKSLKEKMLELKNKIEKLS